MICMKKEIKHHRQRLRTERVLTDSLNRLSGENPTIQFWSPRGIRTIPRIQVAGVEASISPRGALIPLLPIHHERAALPGGISVSRRGKKKKVQILFNQSYEVYSPIGFSPLK